MNEPGVSSTVLRFLQNGNKPKRTMNGLDGVIDVNCDSATHFVSPRDMHCMSRSRSSDQGIDDAGGKKLS